MKIGVAGPVEITLLKNYLHQAHHGTADRVQGLGGSQVTQLVKEYLRLGHEVSVYTLDKTVPPGEAVCLAGERLTIHAGHFRRGARVTLDFQSAERAVLRRFMLDDQPDVIHAHWSYEFAQAAIASKLPHVITVRDWAPAILRLMPRPYRLMRLIMSHITLKKAKVLTANSPYIADKLRRHYRREACVVPNAISDTWLPDAGKHLDAVTPVIVSISNGFGRLKNLQTLIRAQALYNGTATHKAHLKLIGSDLEEGGVANRWVNEHGLDSEYITYMGPLPRDRVMQELARADLMVHPALEESFGNTLIEAMACSVPVIAGKRSGATAWVLDHGKAGKLADIRNPQAVAAAIKELLGDEAQWRYYSNAGHAHTKATFCMRAVASRYSEILQGILAP